MTKPCLHSFTPESSRGRAIQALGMGSCWMDTKIRPETGSWKNYSWFQLSCVAEDKSVSRLLSPPSRGIGWARRAHGYRRRRPSGVALDAVPNLMVEYINKGIFYPSRSQVDQHLAELEAQASFCMHQLPYHDPNHGLLDSDRSGCQCYSSEAQLL